MTRTRDRTHRTPDGPPLSASFGVDGAALRPPDVRAMRERLAGMILPGASDTAGWVDLLGELEALKNTATAAQAQLAVALEASTKAAEAEQGIRADRRGRGVPNQIGAAMQQSPHAGSAFLSTARVWLTGMPHTFRALRMGVLSQWRATLLVRETSHLTAEHRAQIDEQICGPANLPALSRTGTRRLIARVKELAAELDVHACVRRRAKAVAQRCVSVRLAPDLMVHLTALVPMQQGVQAYAQLKKHADAAKAAGDDRGTGQLMADTLIERLTGREPGHADDVPVTINLLVSDQTLLAGGDRPGVVVEGMSAGAGVVPAPVARNLVAHGIDADAAWLRTIYVDPGGRLVASTSKARFHPQGLADLLRAREQGVCATPWCDAQVRHIDHVTPHAEGGPTSLGNSQGLCVRCNHAKQSPGWRQSATESNGRQAVETVTPTGHTYAFVAPEPPEPLRETPPAWTPAVGMKGPSDGRVPRSRYSLGRSAPRHSGTIAYRPRRRRRASSRRQPRADLAWAHSAGACPAHRCKT